MPKNDYTLSNIARALRLPFVSASALPFIAGSVLAKANFSIGKFILGFLAVVATHLSANLINDYADSQSGADWQDRQFYGFFGGSKLIQEGVLSERFYLVLSLCFAALALISILIIVLISRDVLILGYFIIIICLAWAYSYKPLQFSYKRWGEVVIFSLFGPAVVMGGYYIQTGIFPSLKAFMISLPFGFLTTAILFVNEIPDFPQDIKAGKRNWVSIFGVKNAYKGYSALLVLVYLSIIICIALGYLRVLSLISLLFLPIAFKAIRITSKHHDDKMRLLEPSQLTIKLQTLISIILILDILI